MYIDASKAAASASPIIVVGKTFCYMRAMVQPRATNQDGNLASLATQKGAILIYPSSTHNLQCWDCGTSASLTRNGGGDPTSIVRVMATVFLVGTSSGAMMGNVLAAIYPDVLAATAVYSGTAAGAQLSRPALPRTHNDPCGFGHITKPTQQWGKIV
ncbi:putative Acetylxylan esterase A [Seiridium cardinale]